MKVLIGFLCALLIISSWFLAGCNTIEPKVAIPPVVTLATQLTLNLAITNSYERELISNQMYAVAVAVRSLAGGTVPTTKEINEAVRSFTGNDSNLVMVGQAIGSIWSGFYPSVKEDMPLAFEILEAIAQGVEQGAKNIKEGK